MIRDVAMLLFEKCGGECEACGGISFCRFRQNILRGQAGDGFPNRAGENLAGGDHDVLARDQWCDPLDGFLEHGEIRVGQAQQLFGAGASARWPEALAGSTGHDYRKTFHRNSSRIYSTRKPS